MSKQHAVFTKEDKPSKTVRFMSIAPLVFHSSRTYLAAALLYLRGQPEPPKATHPIFAKPKVAIRKIA